MRLPNKYILLLILLIAALMVLSQPTAPTKRAVSPTSQVYREYLPFISSPISNPRGLVGGGVASVTNGLFNSALNATWFYVWGWCNQPGCVPMVRNWELPPSCPPILMLGNEPNNIEPYGHPKSPEDAATISQQIRAMCPGTWLITGNVADFLGTNSAIDWTRQYLNAGGQSDQLGTHCYAVENAQQCVGALGNFVAAFPGKAFCVTEFNTANRQTRIFLELLDYIKTNFQCYAAFTDRDPNWSVYGVNYNMVNDDGSLNAYGEIYRNR